MTPTRSSSRLEQETVRSWWRDAWGLLAFLTAAVLIGALIFMAAHKEFP
jgi:hypothetical protein